MSIYDDLLGDLGVPLSRPRLTAQDILRAAAARRQQEPPAATITPEEEESFTSGFLSTVFKPITWIGEALSKPGRALYGTASGLIDLLQGDEEANFGGGLLNLIPFSDTLGITDPQKSIYGRELLTNLFKNDTTNPEGLDVWDAPGFALDLLAPGAPVGKVATFGGKALRRAGLDDALKAIKPLTGPRTKALKTTLLDVIGTNPVAQQAVSAAAETVPVPLWQKAFEKVKRGKVLTPAERLTEAMDQPLAKMSGVSFLPFSEPTALTNFSAIDPISKAVFGGRTTAEAFAGALDATGRYLKHGNTPGKILTRAFSRAAGEGNDPTFQRAVAPAVQAAKDAARAEGTETVGDALLHLEQAIASNPGGLGILQKNGLPATPTIEDLDLPDIKGKIYRWIEGVEAPPVEYQKFVDDIKAPSLELLDESVEWGTGLNKLVDDYAEYARRKLLGTKEGASADAFSALTSDPSKKARYLHLKGTPGGTDDLVKLFSDEGLNRSIDAGFSLKDLTSAIATHPLVQGRIADTYIKKPPKFNNLGAQVKPAVVAPGRYEELAKTMLGMKRDVRLAGGYADPLSSAHMGFAASKQAHAARKQMLEFLADDELIAEAWRASGNTVDSVPLTKVLAKAGYSPKAAVRKLAELKGLPPTKANLKAVASMQLPLEFADDIRRFYEPMKSPEWGEKFMRFIDGLNAFWKVGMLAHPASKTRDYYSGHANNWFEGAFSGKDILSTKALLKAKDAGGKPDKWIARLMDNPGVRDEMARLGLAKTPENAANALRNIVRTYNLVPARTASEVISPGAADALSGSIQDVLHTLPGGLSGAHRAPTWKETLATLFARKGSKAKTAWKAWDIEPVTGKETGFGAAIVSDDLGWYIGAEQRISGLLTLMRNGFSPAAAARKIKETQLDYTKLGPTGTAFQQHVMTRLFPFYRFMRANTPRVFRNLIERPKSGSAMVAQVQSRTRDENLPLPEAYNKGLSIHLGTGAEGAPRLLTQLGLMDEDALDYIPDSLQGAAHKLASGMNPLVKTLVELTTGTSLYQRDYDQARRLSDMRPLVGQTAANIAGLFGQEIPVKPEKGRLKKSLAQAAEVIVGNSPVSRVIRNLQTATDPRKSAFDKLLNIFTGTKITDIPKDQQDAVLSDLLASAVLDEGGKTFETVYMPAEKRERLKKLAETDPEAVKIMHAMTLRNAIAKRAQDAARAKKKAAEKSR